MIYMTDQAIAAEVRAAIARKRASQNSIAEQVDLTPSALSRRLHGRIPFSATELAKIAEALDVPVGHLYGEQVA